MKRKQKALYLPKDLEAELDTLNAELDDAKKRMEYSDAEGISVVQRQLTQIKHEIKVYTENR